MQREKVVVVGGSGFVGRELCRLCVALGHEVVSISKDGKPDISELEEPWVAGVEWIKGDIEEDRTWTCLEGSLSALLCTPPLDLKYFRRELNAKKIHRVVFVQLSHYKELDFSDYDPTFIRVAPFPVVDDSTWSLQSVGEIHVSQLGMALLRLGLEDDVPQKLGGEALLSFGDVMMIQ